MRLSLIGLFLLKTIAWFVALLLVWHQLGSYVTLPVSWVAALSVDWFFPAWAEGVEQSGTHLILLTKLQVFGIPGMPEGQIALLSPEVAFLKYGYGFPLLMALLFASHAKRLWLKLPMGAILLLPFQVWGVSFDWLKQVMIETATIASSATAREAVALGYQFGYLVLPALVPVVLWAMMDKRFITTFMVEATLEGMVETHGKTGRKSDIPA